MKKTHAIMPQIEELLAMRFFAGNIQFFNQQKVNSHLIGDRVSLARGRGMDFDEVRRYQPGDDIRLIHWKLSAKLGKTYTKIYREERERAIYLVVDQSSSMQFATRVAFKNVLAAKAAAILGFAALNHQEQIGGCVFNDEGGAFVKPRRATKNLLNLFDYLAHPDKLSSTGGSLATALQKIYSLLTSGSIVIIISDFYQLNPEVETYLRLIGSKCEVINIIAYDQLEKNLPAGGRFYFTADGKLQLDIAATANNRENYAEPFKQRINQLAQISRSSNAQLIELATSDDIAATLNYGIKRYGY